MLAESAKPAAFPTFRIDPPSGWASIGFRELWDYRELLYFLTWRDIKLGYKQTAPGAPWAVINPFFMMGGLGLFFGRFSKVPWEGFPYPIFSFWRLLPCKFFLT